MGLVGFSQGAVVVHQLLTELAIAVCPESPAAEAEALRSALAPLLLQRPRFALLVCGFPSRHDAAVVPAELSRELLIAVPSMHISSPQDAIVQAVHQVELAALFRQPVWLRHEHGHAMPQRAEDLRTVVAFCLQHCADDSCSAGLQAEEEEAEAARK